jgi:hypothetical protein
MDSPSSINRRNVVMVVVVGGISLFHDDDGPFVDGLNNKAPPVHSFQAAEYNRETHSSPGISDFIEN